MNELVLEREGLDDATSARFPGQGLELRSQTADAGVFLNNGDGGELAENRGQAVMVQWVESVDSHHRNAYALFLFEPVGDVHGHLGNWSIGKQAKVFSFLQPPNFAKGKWIGSLRRQVRFSRLAEAEIDRPGKINARAGGSGRFGRVARRYDANVGQGAHHGDVFLGVMSAAQSGVGHAASDSD